MYGESLHRMRNASSLCCQIQRYDFFLLMSASRFTENDTWLGNEIARIRRNYFYVRTKIGADISSDRKAHPRTHDEQAVIGKIRDNVVARLKAGTFNTQFCRKCAVIKFLCSSRMTRETLLERTYPPRHTEIDTVSLPASVSLSVAVPSSLCDHMRLLTRYITVCITRPYVLSSSKFVLHVMITCESMTFILMAECLFLYSNFCRIYKYK